MRKQIFAAVVIVLASAITLTLLGCGSKSPTRPTCTVALNPAGLTHESGGGSASIAVTTAEGCGWTGTTTDSWIGINNGSGSGPGTLTYTVASNASSDTRTGTISVSTERYTVTQKGRAATACTYDVSPSSADFTKDGGPGAFTVSAPEGCAWTATSSASWVVLATTSGQGSGTVPYTIARHTEIDGRTASVVVADRTFTIRQSGDVGICQYAVSPVDFTPCMPGGTVIATISAPASCPWTAAVDVPWLSISAGSATGTASLSINFSANYDAARRGTVMIRWPTPTAGQNVRVSQAGCRYAVSRSSFGFIAAGGSDRFDVLQQSDPNTCGGALQDRCVWTAQSNVPWITVTSPMPRTGDNPVAFTVAANDTTSARAGTITVRDQVVTITQSGR